MNYYDNIKQKLLDNKIYSKVKDYSKERHNVITCFEIDKLLNEAGGKYEDNIIEEYSRRLTKELGKRYSVMNLKYMRKFYLFSKRTTSGCQFVLDVLYDFILIF